MLAELPQLLLNCCMAAAPPCSPSLTLPAGLPPLSRYTDLSGRPKHLYGVYQKLQKKGYTLDKIRDVRGLRVIVTSKEECYRAQRAVEVGAWACGVREVEKWLGRGLRGGVRGEWEE